ncbi:MAG: RsmE family RNA methyltransferase [Bacteroidota bacterium]
MTTAFYVRPEHVEAGTLTLTDEEARHASRVLRMRPGDALVAVDGQGGWYRATVRLVTKRTVEAEIEEQQHEVGEPPYKLHLALGVLKNRGRFETLVEKATELGVHTLTPLLTERTERSQVRRDRLEHLAIAAMKQCGRSRLMTVGSPQPLAALLDSPAPARVLCHEADRAATSMLTWAEEHMAPQAEMAVLVGPEGGFSEGEVAAAHAAGYSVASLGPRRLRAETAGMAAATILMIAAASRHH